jgi:hypothetical protein
MGRLPAETSPEVKVVKNIIRVDKTKNPFAQIDRRIFENENLSWKAKGLLAYLLSRPDDWRVIMGDLVKRSTDGADAVRTALGELQKAGHARLEQLRGEGGVLAGTRWIISEAAMPVGEQTEMPVFPISDNPHADNPSLNNKEGNDNEPSLAKPLKEDALSLEAQGFVSEFLKLLEATGARITPPTPSARASWAKTYEQLIRIDGKTKGEIWAVCKWARGDSFWRDNFLSPVKLRTKKGGVSYFDQFAEKMKNGYHKNGTSNDRRFSGSNLDAFADYDRQLAAGA